MKYEFTDNFDDFTEITSGSPPAIVCADGTVTITTTDATNNISGLRLEDINVSSVKIRFTAASGLFTYFNLFIVPAADTFGDSTAWQHIPANGYTLNIGPNWKLTKRKNSSKTLEDSATNPISDHTEYHTVELRIDSNAGTVDAYVDGSGTASLSITDSEWSEGECAVSVGEGVANQGASPVVLDYVEIDKYLLSGTLKDRESGSGVANDYLIINRSTGAVIVASTAEANGTYEKMISNGVAVDVIMLDPDGIYSPKLVENIGET